VLLGSQEYSDDMKDFYNDIVIPDPTGELGIGKRHFIIKYSTDNRNYYIRDLGDGNGTFVKLETPLLLKHGFIISFGDSHMVVQIFEDPEIEGAT
jgi:pSer/pThr/pTyr-binding forkhead associated (FHA) protein